MANICSIFSLFCLSMLLVNLIYFNYIICWMCQQFIPMACASMGPNRNGSIHWQSEQSQQGKTFRSWSVCLKHEKKPTKLTERCLNNKQTECVIKAISVSFVVKMNRVFPTADSIVECWLTVLRQQKTIFKLNIANCVHCVIINEKKKID